jgi:hypothetical protein
LLTRLGAAQLAVGDRLGDGLRERRGDLGDGEQVLDGADRDLAADELLGDRGELEDFRAGVGELPRPAEGLRGAVEGVALVEHRLDRAGFLQR